MSIPVRTAILGALMLWASLAGAADSAQTPAADPVIYDVVFENARAIDPETNLDAVRNIGVLGDKIRAVSVAPLRGRRTIDAHGWWRLPGS